MRGARDARVRGWRARALRRQRKNAAGPKRAASGWRQAETPSSRRTRDARRERGRMARARAAGALTDVRRNHGAGLVDCGTLVMRMAYRVTMRATMRPSWLRVWLWPGRWCRRGSGRGVVEGRGPAGGESPDGWSGVRERRQLAQAASRRRVCGGVARTCRWSMRPWPSVLTESQRFWRSVTCVGVRIGPAGGARDGRVGIGSVGGG